VSLCVFVRHPVLNWFGTPGQTESDINTLALLALDTLGLSEHPSVVLADDLVARVRQPYDDGFDHIVSWDQHDV
jgi:hypothetical protein